MDSAMLLPATTSSVDVSLADVCAFLEHGLDDDDGEDSSMELPPGKRLRMDFGVDSSATEVVSSNSSSTMTVPATMSASAAAKMGHEKKVSAARRRLTCSS